MKILPWKTAVLLLILLSIIVGGIMYISIPNEKKLFQSVIEKKSLSEAKKFFNKYPKSNRKYELEKLIRDWVFEENDLELYRAALSVMPQDSPYREEINTAYHQK